MDQDFLWDRKFVTLESYIHNSGTQQYVNKRLTPDVSICNCA